MEQLEILDTVCSNRFFEDVSNQINQNTSFHTLFQKNIFKLINKVWRVVMVSTSTHLIPLQCNSYSFTLISYQQKTSDIIFTIDQTHERRLVWKASECRLSWRLEADQFRITECCTLIQLFVPLIWKNCMICLIWTFSFWMLHGEAKIVAAIQSPKNGGAWVGSWYRPFQCS